MSQNNRANRQALKKQLGEFGTYGVRVNTPFRKDEASGFSRFTDLKKYDKPMKRNELTNFYEKTRPYLRPSLGNNLQIYSNWNNLMAGPVVSSTAQLLSQQATKKDGLLANLAKVIPPKKLYFSGNQWKGGFIQNYKQKYENQKNTFNTNFSKNNSIVKTTLPQPVIMKEVPQMIRDIIGASKQLGVTSFGPVKRGSTALYVGRWVDPKTGRVRVLPKVNGKSTNPLSFPQKLALLQGRLLNKWNQFQRQQQTYDDFLQKDPVQYQTKAQASLYKRLSQVGSYTDVIPLARFIRQIQNMLIKYFTNQTKDVATGYILNSNAVASELFPDFFSVDLTDVPGMAGLVQQWDNAIDSRRIATLQNIAGDKKLMSKVIKKLNLITYSSIARAIPMIVKSIKSIMLPKTGQQNIDTLLSQKVQLKDILDNLRQKLQYSTQKISSYSNAFKQLEKGVATSLRAQLRTLENIQINSGNKQKYGNQQTSRGSPSPYLASGGSPSPYLVKQQQALRPVRVMQMFSDSSQMNPEGDDRLNSVNMSRILGNQSVDFATMNNPYTYTIVSEYVRLYNNNKWLPIIKKFVETQGQNILTIRPYEGGVSEKDIATYIRQSYAGFNLFGILLQLYLGLEPNAVGFSAMKNVVNQLYPMLTTVLLMQWGQQGSFSFTNNPEMTMDQLISMWKKGRFDTIQSFQALAEWSQQSKYAQFLQSVSEDMDFQQKVRKGLSVLEVIPDRMVNNSRFPNGLDLNLSGIQGI